MRSKVGCLYLIIPSLQAHLKLLRALFSYLIFLKASWAMSSPRLKEYEAPSDFLIFFCLICLLGGLF